MTCCASANCGLEIQADSNLGVTSFCRVVEETGFSRKTRFQTTVLYYFNRCVSIQKRIASGLGPSGFTQLNYEVL